MNEKLWGFTKKSNFFFLGGGVHKKAKHRGELPTKKELGQCLDLREAWQKRGGWCF